MAQVPRNTPRPRTHSTTRTEPCARAFTLRRRMFLKPLAARSARLAPPSRLVMAQRRAVSFAAASAADGLTSEQVEFFKENGYLHLSGFLSPEACDTLMGRAGRYVRECDVKEHRSIFTTSEQARKMNDVYFLESGDKIRYFFEEGAFKKDDPTQTLQVPLEFAINKIGHNLHNLDDEFHKISYADQVQKILKSLNYVRPMAVQSMYIFKQPSIGGEVSAHQDGTFLYTEPQSVTGFWWALEDCTPQNGCLYGVPGSHKAGVRQRFRRTTEEEQAKAGNLLVTEPEKVEPFDLTDSVPIETKKGDLVLLHNAFVHYSNANKSPKSRHAYTVHIVESHNVHYPRENWLQNTDFKPFQPMYEP